MTPVHTKLPLLLIPFLLPSIFVSAIGLGHLADHVGLAGTGHFGNSAMDRYMSLMTPAKPEKDTAVHAQDSSQQASADHGVLSVDPNTSAITLGDDDAQGKYTAPTVPVTYRKYVGDGSLAQGWPAKSAWIPFADMWRQNIETLTRKICDNSEDENSQLLRAIKTVSNSTGVDKRFILAVVMEESRGCVRVHTTSLAVSNPGLMQSYQGLGSCAGTAASPLPLNPCPYTQIQQMIHDGTASNAAGVNLQDLLVRHTEGYQPIDAGTDETAKFYRAARMYNSGPFSISASGELSIGGANACYASDIANRLLGYVGEGCGGGGAAGWA